MKLVVSLHAKYWWYKLLRKSNSILNNVDLIFLYVLYISVPVIYNDCYLKLTILAFWRYWQPTNCLLYAFLSFYTNQLFPSKWIASLFTHDVIRIRITKGRRLYDCHQVDWGKFKILYFLLLIRKKVIVIRILLAREAHYENTPIQIYWKKFNQNKGNFSAKNFWYFSYTCSKHRLRVLVRTASARRF